MCMVERTLGVTDTHTVRVEVADLATLVLHGVDGKRHVSASDRSAALRLITVRCTEFDLNQFEVWMDLIVADELGPITEATP